MKRPFAAYLTESLDRIAGDVPWAYAAILARLGARVVRVRLSGEALTIRGDGGRVRLGDDGSGDVEVSTVRAELVALADGEMTLEEAVTAERLELRGRVDDLMAGLLALEAYLHGAVRCPELSGLMDAFREDVG